MNIASKLNCDSSGRLRCGDLTVTSGVLTTVSSVTAVASLTAVGGVAAFESMILLPMKMCWAQTVLPNIV
jgi:hypothetical protein